MCAYKLGKDRQCSQHVNSNCSSPNTIFFFFFITATEQPELMFLKLTSHADRLRQRTASKGKPRETVLLLGLAFF